MPKDMDPAELEEIKGSISDQLKEQYARGTLDEKRFEELISRTEAVNSKKELAALVPDLPPVETYRDTHRDTQRNNSRTEDQERGGTWNHDRHSRDYDGTLRGKQRDEDTVVTILGEATRKGVWRVPRYLKIFTLLGESTVDFTAAQLPRDVINVDVFAMLGETRIKIPPGLNVEVKGVPILGSFKDQTQGRGDPDAPLLRINGVAFLGEVKIST
jgi:hypothetical protein